VNNRAAILFDKDVIVQNSNDGGRWLGRAVRAVLVAVACVLLPGCIVSPKCGPSACGPSACGPGGCAVAPMCPAVSPSAASHYAEPMWPYYDPAGVPRVMGDTRLRAHLGLSAPAVHFAE
jgi:hypothetical protein